MAESKKIRFAYQEIVTALVKAENIHEGFWEIYFRFGLNAANLSINTGQQPATNEPRDLTPSAIITLPEVGISRVDKLSNLSVDAAKVNPKSTMATKRRNKKTAK